MSKSITDQLKELAELSSDQFRLTDWEIEFVESCTKQVEQGRTPTPKQAAIVDNLWDMVFIKGKRNQR